MLLCYLIEVQNWEAKHGLVPDGVVGAAIVAVLSLAKRDFNAFLLDHEDFIDKQDKALHDTLGTQQYNKDKQIIKDAVYAAEQMGKEFKWTGELKHLKVLELIEGRTYRRRNI